jgi:hypothetical protein
MLLVFLCACSVTGKTFYVLCILYVLSVQLYTIEEPGEPCTVVSVSALIVTEPVGVLNEAFSAEPVQRSSHTGPPGYIGRTRFQPM